MCVCAVEMPLCVFDVCLCVHEVCVCVHVYVVGCVVCTCVHLCVVGGVCVVGLYVSARGVCVFVCVHGLIYTERGSHRHTLRPGLLGGKVPINGPFKLMAF